MLNLSGTGVALVTPFTAENTVDVVALRKIVNHAIDGKVEYLVVLGTTAETATLSPEEKELVKKVIIEENNGRLPLVIGIGGNNTHAMVEEFKTTDLSAFQAILSVTPYYNKPNQEGLFLHYSALASASPLPIILYNVPGRTGVNLLPETVFRLAKKHQNIIGVKEAIGDMNQFNQLIAGAPKGFLVISGDDGLALPVTLAGGAGVISVIAGVFPLLISEMVRLGLSGEKENSYKIHHKMINLIDLIFEEGNPTGVKHICKYLQLSTEVLRLPLISASENLAQKIQKEIQANIL